MKYPVFLVGGAVRDWLLGLCPQEYDFAFAEPEALFLQHNPDAHKVGKSVAVFLREGREYSPLRGSGADAALSERIARDLASRDLTINALALEGNGVLHAHPLALGDLRAGILRPASPHSFMDDPVRVFRLARLACALPDFTVHGEAVAQMREVAATGCLARIPAERVGRECLKAFGAARPSRWLPVLAEGGCLAPWFAECTQAHDIPAGPPSWHSGSVAEHLGAVMDAVAGDALRVWMAFCHDLGKLSTDPDILPHHYGHEARGAVLARELASRLALPARYGRAGETAALLHMKGGMYERLRPGTRCDLLMRVHSLGLDEPFWRLVNADSRRPIRERARHDLDAILAVSLPPEWRNRGPESGRYLRDARCRALL